MMKETQQIKRSDPEAKIPPLPLWPTSQPGPRITKPPAGQRRVLARTDQVVEMEYDQAQGQSTMRSKEQ